MVMGYGYGYILGPSPVPPIYLSGSFGLVRPAWIIHALSAARWLVRSKVNMDAVPADGRTADGEKSWCASRAPTLTDAAPFDAGAAGKKDGMDGNPKEQPAAWMAAWMAAITMTTVGSAPAPPGP